MLLLLLFCYGSHVYCSTLRDAVGTVTQKAIQLDRDYQVCDYSSDEDNISLIICCSFIYVVI